MLLYEAFECGGADHRMKKTIQIALAALAFTALAPAQDVTYNYDAGTDFAKFKSCKWVEMPGGLVDRLPGGRRLSEGDHSLQQGAG